jgi:23S rRNA pseudouridine2605 synthase
MSLAFLQHPEWWPRAPIRQTEARMSNPQEPERLQKVLSRLGLASRREAEQWIRAGRLTVNGHPAAIGDRVSSGDQLRLDGRLIRQPPPRRMPLLLCHRSPGMPLLPVAEGIESMAARLPASAGKRFTSVSPMPQIDGGLELLCADGALAGRLQRAVRMQPVEFSLRVRGELSDVQQAGILAGQLDSGVALPIHSLKAAGGEGSNRWYQLTGQGLSGNDLRQLLERQGVSSSRLLRTRLGAMQLERSLPRGRWREMTDEETESLLHPPPAQDSADAASAPAGNPGSGH